MLIAGAGGFAKELIEAVLQRDPAAQPVFYDDQTSELPELFLGRFEILRSESEAEKYFTSTDPSFALGIGDPLGRKMVFDRFLTLGGKPTSIVSPLASVGSINNSIGEGLTLLSHGVIETNNKIGNGVLVHVGALISHDVTVGNFCEISPRASLLGNVRVGDMCRLGTGCTVLPGVSIGNNVVVGAGSIVTHDIPDHTVVIGIPGRITRHLDPLQLP